MPLPAPGEPPLLLHNPRCSKSRAAKQLLEQEQVEFEERRYLERPLGRDELQALAERLGLHPREWVRAGERRYAELGLRPDLPAAALLDALAAHPELLERPILVTARAARVGRPPERVLELLEDKEPPHPPR